MHVHNRTPHCVASSPDSLALVLSGARITIPGSRFLVRALDKTSARESGDEANSCNSVYSTESSCVQSRDS